MAAISSTYEKIIKYIDEHIKNDITLDEISKFAGYSQWHLYKIFKIYSPAPIMEYIRNKRLYAAANEIYTGKKLLEVALDYGYETPAGFYKAFQRVFRCNPSEYKINNTRRNIFMKIENVKTIEELDEVAEFFKIVYTDSPIEFEIKEGEKYSNEWWIEQFNKNPELFLYAKDGDKICGAISGWVEHNNNVTVSSDGVLKEYVNQGIHEALFIEFEKRAKKLGCNGIGLGIGEGQEEFYAKLGYVGRMLIQSEKYSVEELKNFLETSCDKNYELTGTNIYDGYINQIWLNVSILDKELKKKFEVELGDCWTQIIVGKGI
ncbi:MAG: GNAT family N-acetyltransferase [Oscillospiraceae bacterium]|nr:GNAT family N-acetyltransferase [Oscillospiraceae bacterium]